MNHTSKVTKLLTRVMLVSLVAFALAQKAQAETFVVDRLTDKGEGEKFMGDLRYCITNARSGEDVIVFAVTGTINLTRALPDLDVSVSIEGPGPELLTVRRDTGGLYRIFTVSSSATVNITASVRKTHRAVVVEAGAGFAGMGSEIAAFLTEDAFDELDAPVERVTGANAPMPYARNLERAKTPTKDTIMAAIRRVCAAEGAR